MRLWLYYYDTKIVVVISGTIMNGEDMTGGWPIEEVFCRREFFLCFEEVSLIFRMMGLLV